MELARPTILEKVIPLYTNKNIQIPSRITIFLKDLGNPVLIRIQLIQHMTCNTPNKTSFQITLSHEMLQNPALIYRGRSISFSELNNMANQLARVIAVSICSKSKNKYVNTDGDLIVAVAMPPSDALVVTLLACWKIGAAYLPIDPTFPPARIDHILTESEPSLVITHKKGKHLLNT